MPLDAIIIADCSEDHVSVTSSMKLLVDNRVADIQTVLNFVENEGSVKPPVQGDGQACWSAAPKLNGIYLYDYLRKHGFSSALIMSYFEQEHAFVELLRQSPKVIIVSTTFILNKETLRNVTDSIRAYAPGIPIIAGGQFVYYSYLFRQKALSDLTYESVQGGRDYLFLEPQSDPDIDLYIISPRGEQTLIEAMSRIDGKRFDGMTNSARFTGLEYRYGEMREECLPPWDIPIEWELLPDDLFESGVIPLQASIGCSYRCTFCNFVKNPRLTAIKPLEHLIADMKAVARRGIRYVWFTDDNFRLGSKDLNEVCERMIAEKLDLKWISFVRAGVLKDVDYGLLQKAGCHEVQLGLESADVEILKSMRKEADVALYHDVIRKLLAAGINCSCYFVFGFPGETEETVKTTAAFIRSIEHPELGAGTLSWSIFPFILAPLSPIYEADLRTHHKLSGYLYQWEHATMTARQARDHVKAAFFSLNDSGPIYRGDNLDLLQALPPARRKEFAALRHRLAKGVLAGKVGKAEILAVFRSFFAGG
jgi:radical SAM superfamily enzyme YgiQ (UPF0313 family)